MAELLLLEGDDLPELMARVRDQLGPRATIVRAERVRSGGIAGFFAREHYELTVEVPDPPKPMPRLAVRPAPGADPFEAALDAADRAEAGQDEPAPPVSTTGARFATVLEQARALAGEGSAAPRMPPAPAPATAVASPAPAAPAPAPAPPRPPAAARTGSAVSTAWGQAALGLLSAGVPASFLDRAASVADVLDAIPEPPRPPRRPGQVLVVLGEGDAAEDVVALLRHQWKLPAEAVLVAGEGALTSSSGVVRWRIRASEAEHPWLLVARTPDDRQGRHLATGLVAAAQPDQVWAVVDARTKPEDAARWLEQVGAARRPDALAVQGLLETSDPGTVLGLGLPVAWADGVPASRVMWAAALGQGLDAALARQRP